MTTNRDGLILDLDFSQQPVDGKITDNSGNDHHAAIHGGVTSVTDPTFGRCVALDGQDGSFLQLEPMTVDFSGGFTIESFVWYDQFARYSPIINFGSGQGRHNILLNNYDVTGRMGLEVYNASERIVHKVTREAVFEIGKWLHIAITIEADGSLMFYKNAQPQLRQPHSGKVPTSESRVEPYVGKSNWTNEKTLHGKVATLRTYNRALTPQELWRSYTSSRMTTFRASHPVDFKLYDANDNATIYIAGPHNQADQKLNLDVINTSGANLYWGNVDTTIAPNQEHHHLELRFRKGVLSPDTLANGALSDATQWKLGTPSANDQLDRWDSLYLTYTGSDHTFAAGSTIPLNLAHFHANGRGGSRGTQVELVTNQLHRSANRQDPTVRQTRVHHLNIVNHQGTSSGSGSSGNVNASGGQHIPLHIGFVGSNTILNDGAAHPGEKLRLRFTNSSLTQTISLDDPNLKFTLRVPTGDASDEWALGTADDVRAIMWTVLNTGGNVKLADGTGGQGPSPFWEIDHAKVPHSARELGPNESFDVELDFTNFSTQHPTGAANLTVHYENIPGYWDGQFVVPIQKSPLLFRGQNVGIGTVVPTKADSATVLQIGTDKLDQSASNGQLVLGRNDGSGSRKFRLGIDGSYNFGIGDYGDNSDTTYRQDLTIRGLDGNVGIGNTNPASKLAVSGGATIGTSYGSEAAPANGLLVEGNVGIGTKSPDAKLHINGNVQISAKNTLEFGAGVDGKQSAAGKIGYQAYSNGLDIVGAGSTDSARRIKLWAEGGAQVNGHLSIGEDTLTRIHYGTAGKLGTAKDWKPSGDNPGLFIEANIPPTPQNPSQTESSGIFMNGDTLCMWNPGDSDLLRIYDEDDISERKGPKFRITGDGGIVISNPKDAVPVSDEGGGKWDLTINSKTGRLSREGSSIRYKQNVRLLKTDFRKILTIEPRVYEMKSAHRTGEPSDIIGYIAEELDQQGLSALVQYDSQGRPDGISYKKICIYLNEVVKEQQSKLVELSERLTNLESAGGTNRNGAVFINGHAE